MQVVGSKSALGFPFGLLNHKGERERAGEGGNGLWTCQTLLPKNTTTFERNGKGKRRTNLRVVWLLGFIEPRNLVINKGDFGLGEVGV
jgi:hypothetical protein